MIHWLSFSRGVIFRSHVRWLVSTHLTHMLVKLDLFRRAEHQHVWTYHLHRGHYVFNLSPVLASTTTNQILLYQHSKPDVLKGFWRFQKSLSPLKLENRTSPTLNSFSRDRSVKDSLCATAMIKRLHNCIYQLMEGTSATRWCSPWLHSKS